MQWAEVSVDTSHEAMDLVSEILQELGAAGVVIEDPALLNEYIRSGLWDYTDLKESEETEVVRVKAYWALDEELEGKLQNLSERLASLAQHGIDKGAGAVSWKAVADEDWAETWKAFFHTEGMAISPENINLMGDVKPDDDWKTDREIFLRAWQAAGGNVSRLANLLDVSRVTLYRYLKKFQLEKV